MTTKQIYDFITKQLKRLINSEYYTSISMHQKTNIHKHNWFSIFIQDEDKVIFNKHIGKDYEDNQYRLNELKGFIDDLLNK